MSFRAMVLHCLDDRSDAQIFVKKAAEFFCRIEMLRLNDNDMLIAKILLREAESTVKVE
jgi:hypothetical protein